MTNNVTIEIKGMTELRKIIRELPYQVRSNLVRQALRKSAKPMKDEAVNLAPQRKGTTKKAITIVNYIKTSDPMILIAPTKGRSAKHDAWYARFHEFGTAGFGKRKIRVTSIDYNERGKLQKKYKTVAYKRQGSGLPAIRFMQRAFESKKQETLGQVNKHLSDVVTKYLRKNAPKYYVG